MRSENRSFLRNFSNYFVETSNRLLTEYARVIEMVVVATSNEDIAVVGVEVSEGIISVS